MFIKPKDLDRESTKYIEDTEKNIKSIFYKVGNFSVYLFRHLDNEYWCSEISIEDKKILFKFEFSNFYVTLDQAKEFINLKLIQS